MNICMFTNTYLPHVGGVANSVSRFTEDLRRMGHHVLVVAPTFAEAGETAEEDNRILRVPAIQNFNGSDFSVRIPIPFVINEKIDEFMPDIVHSHHPYLLGDAAVRAARRRNLPIVFTHHTLYEKYTHYVSENSPVMEKFAANLSTEYANLCTRVIAPSESIAQLIAKRGVEIPITVIPTGVDVEFFAGGRQDAGRKAQSVSERTKVVGHVGRLAPEKNIPFLAQAVVRYIQEEPDAVFLVVGDGPGRTDFIHRFEEAGITDRLILAGKKTGRALADAYAAMDIFVFASKTETQGMVLTEAMAAGKPVIAIDASGTREVVDDRQNGRCLPENTSPDAFAGAIRDFFSDRNRADRWRKKACKTAKQFSRKVCAERLIQMYQRLAGKKPVTENDMSDELISWDNLLNGMKAEWDLISGKAKAVAVTVKEDNIKEE